MRHQSVVKRALHHADSPRNDACNCCGVASVPLLTPAAVIVRKLIPTNSQSASVIREEIFLGSCSCCIYFLCLCVWGWVGEWVGVHIMTTVMTSHKWYFTNKSTLTLPLVTWLPLWFIWVRLGFIWVRLGFGGIQSGANSLSVKFSLAVSTFDPLVFNVLFNLADSIWTKAAVWGSVHGPFIGPVSAAHEDGPRTSIDQRHHVSRLSWRLWPTTAGLQLVYSGCKLVGLNTVTLVRDQLLESGDFCVETLCGLRRMGHEGARHGGCAVQWSLVVSLLLVSYGCRGSDPSPNQKRWVIYRQVLICCGRLF